LVIDPILTQVFHILKTFCWFSNIPVSWLMNQVGGWLYVPGVDVDEKPEKVHYRLEVHQYFYLPFVAVCLFGISCAAFISLGFRFNRLFAAIICSTMYLCLTGGIHMDGLSDTVDGWFAYGKNRFRVVKESQAGAIGVAYTVLWTILFISTLSYVFWNARRHLDNSLLLVAAIPFFLSRIQVGYLFKHHYTDADIAKADGIILPNWEGKLGILYQFYLAVAYILASITVATIGSQYVATYFAVCAIGGIILLIPFFNWRVVKTLGFINGDVLGAYICISELIFLWIYIGFFVRG
jgi:adenosylcobinamide-GDP ribazoletransferase